MGLLGEEKRKNDESPRRFFPVWLVMLVLGFILGAVFILMTRPVTFQTGATFSGNPVSDEGFYLTATSIIDRATQTAAAEKTATQAAVLGLVSPQPTRELDPIFLTATYIVGGVTQTVEAQQTATRQAQATPSPTS